MQVRDQRVAFWDMARIPSGTKAREARFKTYGTGFQCDSFKKHYGNDEGQGIAHTSISALVTRDECAFFPDADCRLRSFWHLTFPIISSFAVLIP
jgi:hypothetical protein